jgi:hypothetical protein
MDCTIDECTTPAAKGRRGMCWMHYYRLRLHGTTKDPRRPWFETFWSHVDKSGECWLWTSVTDHAGYGIFGGSRAPMRAAHRISWTLANGNPGKSHVLHHCDNPPCVRPEHLFLGDDAANHDDMAGKKRSTWGERNHHAKLNSADVRAIRTMLEQGELHRVIADRFGVSKVTISDIKRRRSWGQLD